MNEATLELVKRELDGVLTGKTFGRVYPLARRSLAVDLHLSGSRYLFISAETNAPRIYLVRRRLKDLERESVAPQSFHLLLKKYIAGAELAGIEKVPNDRVLFFRFRGVTETGETASYSLAAQLTGRSANIFLLDGDGRIVGSLAEKDIDGQRLGEEYFLPLRGPRQVQSDSAPEVEFMPEDAGSISSALDRHYSERERENRFRSRAEEARKKLAREIARRQRLIQSLEDDLGGHGDAEKWKRYGDLILANLSTAKRRGDNIIVLDYFDETAPEIEIEADENLPLTEAAQRFFKRYSKSSNAQTEIQRRIGAVRQEIEKLLATQDELELAIARHDESFLADEVTQKAQRPKKEKQRFTGARPFVSSDGFEILVGKKAVDNDYLTFRVAGSLDTWLHAADYPGSHVVIRNPNRKEIPHNTLLEAAQLAAFYSSAKSQPKAAVHYTQKKFVNKPRGAAPGLVRLASFKTILVEPGIPPKLDQKTQR